MYLIQSGNSGTVRESNQATGVDKGALRVELHLYVQKSILLAGTGVRKISSVLCGFSPIKIHFSDYLKSFNQQNKSSVCIFPIKYRYILLKKKT